MPNPLNNQALEGYTAPTHGELLERSTALLQQSKRRRSIRKFSDKPVPREVIENCLKTAGTAPSGANQQPWHFAAVQDFKTKSAIRAAAESEEQTFYESRAPQDWLEALAPLGTNAEKHFLETAPWLIVIFSQPWSQVNGQEQQKHYYARESVGIATGFLIQAIHHAGLASLTHTPSPMGFLNTLLGRPSHEKAFLILVVGYPADDATVPCITKKSLSEISSFH
jgi:nitroreductase